MAMGVSDGAVDINGNGISNADEIVFGAAPCSPLDYQGHICYNKLTWMA